MSWEALPVVVAGQQFGASLLDPLTDDLNLVGIRPGSTVSGGITASASGTNQYERIPISTLLRDQDPTGIPLWFSPTFDAVLQGIQYTEFTCQTPGFYKGKAQVQFVTDDANGVYREAVWLINGTQVFQSLDGLMASSSTQPGQSMICSCPIQWLNPGDVFAFQLYNQSAATVFSTQTSGTYANVEMVSR